MKIACDPRLRREVTAVARRQTYKTFGVGHNSFQDTRNAQEVTTGDRAENKRASPGRLDLLLTVFLLLSAARD